MALSVKAELQITGLAGGDLGVDGVPWQSATVTDLKVLLHEQLRLPLSSSADDRLSFLAGSSGMHLADGDRLTEPHVRGKKIIVRGAELPSTPVRRPWFLPDAEVLLHSLAGAPELNGQRATVCGWDALKCRYTVLMDSTKLQKSVKPDNLRWAWISPVLINPAGGDHRQAHVPLSRVSQQSGIPISGPLGPLPGHGAVHGSASGPPLGNGADGYDVTHGRAACNGMSHARSTPPEPSVKAEAATSASQLRERELQQQQDKLEATVSSRLSDRMKELRLELQEVTAEKMRAVEVEDFKLASKLKKRQQELTLSVKELEDSVQSM